MITQLSPLLADELMATPLDLIGLSHDERISKLYWYGKQLEVIQELGWFEHTSDWDPYLMVTMNDKSELETESGYCDLGLSVDGKEVMTYRMFFKYVSGVKDRHDPADIKYVVLNNEIYNEDTEQAEQKDISILIDDIRRINVEF